MNIGIVGNEAAKFTPQAEEQARRIIRELLSQPDAVLVSGGCHLGGADIYAEEEADKLGIAKIIHKPKKLQWSGGYRERNILIARDSHELHNIVIDVLPPDYKGMRFDYCYHCGPACDSHVKSGGCWTARQAERLGKKAVWHIVSNRIDNEST